MALNKNLIYQCEKIFLRVFSRLTQTVISEIKKPGHYTVKRPLLFESPIDVSVSVEQKRGDRQKVGDKKLSELVKLKKIRR